MPKKRCICPGCPACGPGGHHPRLPYDKDTSPSGRCLPCHQQNRRTRDRMRDRPSATARGYGAEHRATRAPVLAQLDQISACWRCGHAMDKTIDRLELDHTDDRTGYAGFSHGSPCRTCGKRCNAVAAGWSGRADQVCVNSAMRPGYAPLSPSSTAQRKALPGAHYRDVRSPGDGSSHVELRPRMKDKSQADSDDQHGQRQTADPHPYLPVGLRLPSTETGAHNANGDESLLPSRHDRTVSMASGAQQSVGKQVAGPEVHKLTYG